MLETYIRPIYQHYLVNPIAKRAKNISPLLITYVACLSGILSAFMIALGQHYLAITLLLFSGFFDTLDGTLARITHKTSDRGAILDILSDRIVELAILLGLFAVDPTHRSWLTLAMLGSCYLCVTSFLVIGIFTTNESQKGFYYSPGFIERAEAFIFFIFMIIFPEYFIFFASLFTLLVLLTSYLHIRQFIALTSKIAV